MASPNTLPNLPDPFYTAGLGAFWLPHGLSNIRAAIINGIPEPLSESFSGIYDNAHNAAPGNAYFDMYTEGHASMAERIPVAANAARLAASLLITSGQATAYREDRTVSNTRDFLQQSGRALLYGEGSSVDNGPAFQDEALAYGRLVHQRLGFGQDEVRQVQMADRYQGWVNALTEQLRESKPDKRRPEQLLQLAVKGGAAYGEMTTTGLLPTHDGDALREEAIDRISMIAHYISAIGVVEDDRSNPHASISQGNETYLTALLRRDGVSKSSLEEAREMAQDRQSELYGLLQGFLTTGQERRISKTVVWFIRAAYYKQRREMGLEGNPTRELREIELHMRSADERPVAI